MTFIRRTFEKKNASRILRINCAEITIDRSGQVAYEIFNIERTF